MKMPIVYMRRMSMNEGIAATCCFRQAVTQQSVYQEVLSGGSLGSGPFNDLSWKSEIPQEWGWLPFDVDFSGYEGNTPVPYFNNTTESWWVLYFTGSQIVYASSLDELLTDPEISLSVYNERCDHMGRNCLYVNYAMDIKTLHFGATAAHVHAGPDFALTHEAMQYSS